MGLLWSDKFSVSSAMSLRVYENFCCLIALKFTSIEIYSFGFSFPYLTSTLNYWGNFSQPSNLNLIGTALVLWSFNSRFIVWLSRIRVNLIGLPYLIYIMGFEPRHLSGTVIGVGLFLIIIISSSTNALGSSGIDQTLSYFGGSSGLIVHLSN